MIEVQEYSLPDFEIFRIEWPDYHFYSWLPDRTYIVLGTGNKPEDSVECEMVKRENIPVLKRPSGGQPVVLTNGMLVISTLAHENGQNDPRSYFFEINKKIIRKLNDAGISGLEQKGISDITIRNKKILGSAIYRYKSRIFYHGILNISESPDTIAKYLKHPLREPEYRMHRSHLNFITSLKLEGYSLSPGEIKQVFDSTV